MVQPQSLVSLTRRFVHIKEQRLLDKAADWNALVRNLELDKGRSAKGGNSGVKLFMPNSPTWIPSFGFQERLEEVNWKDLTYELFMTCLGLSLKFFILFLCTPSMHAAGAVEIHAHPAEGVAEESVPGHLRALSNSMKTNAVCASYWHVLKAEQGELKARFLL